MKRLIAVLGMLVLATGATVYAQQPASQAPAASAGQQTPKAGGDMTGMMPMQMCREMMAGHSMMGPGMMGQGRGMGEMMGGAQGGDPKAMAQMMEMRGEMMKAMGDILLKYAKRMQETPTPAK